MILKLASKIFLRYFAIVLALIFSFAPCIFADTQQEPVNTTDTPATNNAQTTSQQTVTPDASVTPLPGKLGATTEIQTSTVLQTSQIDCNNPPPERRLECPDACEPGKAEGNICKSWAPGTTGMTRGICICSNCELGPC